VLLLFDRSASTLNQWSFLLRAVTSFLDQLREQDRVALAAFDEKPEMLLSWRSPRTGTRGLTIHSDGSGTDLYRALDWATRELRSLKGRKGVVVYTDGIDNRLTKELVTVKSGNTRIATPAEDDDFLKTIRGVMALGAPFYFVAVNTDVNSGADILSTVFERQLRMQARLRMELVSDRSNGHIFFPKELRDVGSIYEQIGRELSSSYSLGFTPARTTPDGRTHKIEIRVRDKNMRVTQSREEYVSR
jgi:VWFA-related protein